MAGGMGGGPFGGPFGGPGGGRFHFSDSNEKPNLSKAMLSRIAKYFSPYWKLLILLIFLIIVTSVLGLLPPILTKNIIDKALPDKNLSLLIVLTVATFGSTVLSGLVNVAQNYLNSWISKHIMFDLRNSMFKHLQYMGIRFFSNVQTGEITSRMNNDIGGIEGIFSGTIVQIIQNVLVFSTTAVTLFITNWKLGIVGMLILPLFIAPTRKVGKLRWKIASVTQTKYAELNSIMQETLNVGGTMLVKLFTKEKKQQLQFENVNKELTKLQIRESLAGRWFFMTIQTFTSIGPMLIYLAGGILLIMNNEITIGSIVMFVSLLSRLYGPVASFANISVDVTRSIALFERIFEYFDMKQEIIDSPNAITIDKAAGNIVFDNVTFSYNGTAEALQDVDITITSGQTVAFVGPSGAGKTTITYLVPRLYDVSTGSIRLDGTDIRDITVESLRAQIGMVTQDTYLFNSTIKENLLFAKPDATEDELMFACKSANIVDMINTLPEGFDTLIGERGIKLSGGEKQRLSIARTLLKNPQIVILDEATSALDSVSEELIQQAIQPLLKNRTSLVIAHRLSTIMAADCIYVVSHGRIVEQGRHEELLALNGVYKELCDKQFKKQGKDYNTK